MGRPPKERKKDAHLSVRISAKLRDDLDAARQQADTERSLSQEVEARLQSSFEVDKDIKKKFGGNGTYRALVLIGNGIAAIEFSTGLRWFEDRFTFNEVVAFVETFFDYLKP